MRTYIALPTEEAVAPHSAAWLAGRTVSKRWWLVPFVLVSVLQMVAMPRVDELFFRRYGDRVIEPEIKWVLAAVSC
jgi:hypothetical protein